MGTSLFLLSVQTVRCSSYWVCVVLHTAPSQPQSLWGSLCLFLYEQTRRAADPWQRLWCRLQINKAAGRVTPGCVCARVCVFMSSVFLRLSAEWGCLCALIMLQREISVHPRAHWHTHRVDAAQEGEQTGRFVVQFLATPVCIPNTFGPDTNHMSLWCIHQCVMLNRKHLHKEESACKNEACCTK